MTETYSYPTNFRHWCSIYSRELQLHAQMFTDLARALGHEDLHSLSEAEDKHAIDLADWEDKFDELNEELLDTIDKLQKTREELDYACETIMAYKGGR